MTIMTYTNLVGLKGTAGSIANWVNYSKIQDVADVILEEAQALLYSMLRVREMQTTFSFRLGAGNVFSALPTRFQDPIGDLRCINQNFEVSHKLPSTVKLGRSFSVQSGTLGTNPYTTVNGSSLVTVALTAHGFSQGSVFSPSAFTLNGIAIDGAFEIVSIAASGNSFVIETGTAATAGSSGGGAGITYDCMVLAGGSPQIWSIWDNRIQFDQPVPSTLVFQISYFQSLPVLSATNPSNFLTDRRPQLLRAACQAQSADFMKDTEEYNKAMQRLSALVDRVSVEDDLLYRGADLETWNPPHGS